MIKEEYKHIPTGTTAMFNDNGSVVEISKETMRKIVSNGSDWIKISSKDYKVLEFLNGSIIRTVVNLSNNQVFSLNDELATNTGVRRIQTIREINGEIVFFLTIEHGNQSHNIHNRILMRNAKKIPKVIYTTFDGVKIFDKSQEIWAIDKRTFKRKVGQGNSIGTWLNGWYTTDKVPNPKEADFVNGVIKKLINDRWLIFSSEEAANQFILYNTPCLSINDVAKVYKTANMDVTSSLANKYKYPIKLLEIAKQNMKNE